MQKVFHIRLCVHVEFLLTRGNLKDEMAHHLLGNVLTQAHGHDAHRRECAREGECYHTNLYEHAISALHQKNSQCLEDSAWVPLPYNGDCPRDVLPCDHLNIHGTCPHLDDYGP